MSLSLFLSPLSLTHDTIPDFPYEFETDSTHLTSCSRSFPADSDRCRDLREAVEYPVKNTIPLYDEMQFPPVTPITVE